MYRSCSTWQYQVASHLVETHRNARRIGFLFGNQFAELDQSSGEPAWQVLKSHEGHEAFARALEQGRALGLYSYRDLRDVVFSLMHKFDLSFADVLFKERLLEGCLASDRFWTSQPNMLCQRYEDIIRDPAKAIKGIAAHLQIALGEEETQAIASDYSFEANLERTQAIRKRFNDLGVDLTRHENALANDHESLLHWNHLRSGSSTGWQSAANQQERAELARICGEWLIARGYEQGRSWVEVSADDAWRQFDCTRNELAQVRRQVIGLEASRAESQGNLAKTVAELEQARIRIEEGEAANTESASLRAEALKRIAQLELQLTEAVHNTANQI
jgi:hypothetical protein